LNEKIEDVNVKEGQIFTDVEMEKYGKYFTEYPIEYFSMMIIVIAVIFIFGFLVTRKCSN
jgi:hypothetical protein